MSKGHWQKGIGIFAALMVMLGGPAAAQTVDQAKMKAFLASSGHAALLSRALDALPKDVFNRCPALKSPPGTVAVAKSIEFDDESVPVKGAWSERLPISGCGNDTILNFFFSADANGKINTVVGFPGTTRASIVLQKDAFAQALLALGAREKCEKARVRATRFGALGLKVSAGVDLKTQFQGSPWWEVWTLAGCEHSYDVLLQFVPDDTGTKIIAPLGGINVRR